MTAKPEARSVKAEKQGPDRAERILDALRRFHEKQGAKQQRMQRYKKWRRRKRDNV